MRQTSNTGTLYDQYDWYEYSVERLIIPKLDGLDLNESKV